MNKYLIMFKKYKVSLITGLLVVFAFLVGLGIGAKEFSTRKTVFNIQNNEKQSAVKVDMNNFWKAWDLLENKFVPSKGKTLISDDEKLWGSIKGLASSYGDPYTVFMPPEDAKIFDGDVSGSFEGVGMELGMRDGIITVVSPLKGTPAYKAGVKSGDKLLFINGTSTEGMSTDWAVKIIRGTAGTPVKIKFYREKTAETFEKDIVRARIDIPTIETEVKGDVFVLKLYNFYAPSSELFKGALKEFIDSGKTKLVLDLRGNPGGYLESSVDIASWFLPLGKTIVREDFGNNTEETVYRSKGYDIFNENLRMVILVNEGSASASEILAGALKEQGKAKLVGTKTFGKGSVQEVLRLDGGASLKVTIARWLTPLGNSISENGLTPDYKVDITDKDVTAGRDPQLEKALEVVNSL
jgi:carboxyl-terminal processing protease